MTPPSPYPRGEACPKCGQLMGLENECWCEKKSPVLRIAAAIVGSAMFLGAACCWVGISSGPIGLFVAPFGAVIFVGASLSGLLILFGEMRSGPRSG